jgi:chromosome segregation ATPase
MISNRSQQVQSRLWHAENELEKLQNKLRDVEQANRMANELLEQMRQRAVAAEQERDELRGRLKALAEASAREEAHLRREMDSVRHENVGLRDRLRQAEEKAIRAGWDETTQRAMMLEHAVRVGKLVRENDQLRKLMQEAWTDPVGFRKRLASMIALLGLNDPGLGPK